MIQSRSAGLARLLMYSWLSSAPAWGAEQPIAAKAADVSGLTFTISENWRQLSPYPRELGVAGVLAGQHNGVVIAAGGANFPDGPPWEGGKKKTYDDIHVFIPSENTWRPAGRLPEPRGYAAMVSLPDGVLVLGGENADQVFGDSLWLRWNGNEVVVSPGPALPFATTSPVAAILNDQVYAAAGYAAGQPRVSKTAFWRLDPKRIDAGWTVLPAWPGPSRGQGVMGSVDGAIYLLSGIELVAGPDGKSKASYLADAFCYRPEEGWRKLPDLPRSAIAAPSPAPVSSAPRRLFVLGGVDGRKVGKQPRDTRVPDDILCFDLARQEWTAWAERWPDPVVTTPSVQVGEEWLFISGEIMSGVRTPHVWSWTIESPVAR